MQTHPHSQGTGVGQRRDRLWQGFYQLAYLLCRCFWFVFRPVGRGALVAIWYKDHLLLIRNGYRQGFNLPGGGCLSGESARRAAVREIREEVGLDLTANQLHYRGTFLSHREYKRDHCAYFEAHLKAPPVIDIDGREVVEAVFAKPADWNNYPLAHQVKKYIKHYYP